MSINDLVTDLMDKCAANEKYSPLSFKDDSDVMYCRVTDEKCVYQSKKLYVDVRTSLCHGVAFYEEDAYKCNKKFK